MKCDQDSVGCQEMRSQTLEWVICQNMEDSDDPPPRDDG